MTDTLPQLPGISGKNALVTGAASGIGRATALLLDRMGARVTIGDIDSEGLEKTSREMTNAHAIQYDACDAQACISLVKEAATDGLDMVCNIAGYLSWAATKNFTTEQFIKTVQINLVSTFTICREAYPYLEKSKGGIVNTASTAAIIGIPYSVAYTASKHGVAGLTKSLALEWAPNNIRVNAICPGQVDTAMSRQTPTANDIDWALLLRNTPKLPNGILAPEEIAAQIVWMQSDMCKRMTGSIVVLDAGQSAG